MEFEYGACEPEDLPELGALADLVFRSRRPGEMLAEYPLLFDPANAANLLVARREGRIVAHVGLCPREVSVLGVRLGAASVGAVCTHPDCRGAGVATELMERARRRARELGAQLLLISGGRGLYRRLGYVEVGDFEQWRLPAGEVPGRYTLRPAGPGDLDALQQLHRREPVRFHRDGADWRRLLEAGMLMNQPGEVWLVRESGGPVAYVALQKPRPDRPEPRVLEMGGCRSALLDSLPGLAMGYDAEAVEVVAYGDDLPWRSGCSARRLEPVATAMEGTAGILDPAGLLDRVGPLLAERTGIRPVWSGDEQSGLLQGVGEAAELTASELTRLVFAGRAGEPAPMDRLPPGMRSALLPALPLPLPWYGLNYV